MASADAARQRQLKREGRTEPAGDLFSRLAIAPEECDDYKPVIEAFGDVSRPKADLLQALVGFVNGIASDDGLAAFTDQRRLKNALMVGAAWVTATEIGIFKEYTASDVAPLIGYGISHPRTCARLFNKRDKIKPAADLWSQIRDRVDFTPRKAEGVDYTDQIIRVYETWQGAGENADESQRIDAVNKLVRVRPQQPDLGFPSPSEQILRLGWLNAYAMRLLAEHGIANPLSNFMTPRDLLDWVARAKWDEEKDGATYDKVRETPFAEIDVPNVEALLARPRLNPSERPHASEHSSAAAEPERKHRETRLREGGQIRNPEFGFFKQSFDRFTQTGASPADALRAAMDETRARAEREGRKITPYTSRRFASAVGVPIQTRQKRRRSEEPD